MTSQGVDVVHLGLCSTDEVFFASGHWGAPAAQLTASHNPAQYNGIKLCLSGAKPVGEDSGLGEIKAAAPPGWPHRPRRRRGRARRPGAVRRPRAQLRGCGRSGRRCASSPTPPTGWAG
ncbi:MAG: hypothetical protein R2690_13615 [Acidimicrobiales bacterium]